MCHLSGLKDNLIGTFAVYFRDCFCKEFFFKLNFSVRVLDMKAYGIETEYETKEGRYTRNSCVLQQSITGLWCLLVPKDAHVGYVMLQFQLFIIQRERMGVVFTFTGCFDIFSSDFFLVPIICNPVRQIIPDREIELMRLVDPYILIQSSIILIILLNKNLVTMGFISVFCFTTSLTKLLQVFKIST